MKTKEDTKEMKNVPLAKKLNDYMVENNKELYKYLADKGELKGFLVDRSNAAFEAYSSAVGAGFPAPDEISNQILFCGMENSYREYVESLLEDNFLQFFGKLNKKPAHLIDNIIETIVFACMGVFYENLGNTYGQVMDKLDDELIKVLEHQTKIIML
jgi:hypothetical protein